MKTIQGCLTRIHQNGLAVCIEFDQPLQPVLQPGQFMLARGAEDILSVPLFPCGLQGIEYTSPLCGKRHWSTEESFAISLPHGNGFDNVGKSKRLLMVSGTITPLRLFPLAGRVIQDGGEAALFTHHLPDTIPPEIELLTQDQLAEAISWADTIIGDTSIDQVINWVKLITAGGKNNPNTNVQILMDTPVVCAGSADCGVCAVKTRHGWKHACTDGPVFKLSELEI
jgi:hypothetical protein